MSDKTKSVRGPIGRVRVILEDHGQACLQLAQDLDNDGGRELKDHELRIIRTAMLPAIQEEYEIALSRYLIGGQMLPDFCFTEF